MDTLSFANIRSLDELNEWAKTRAANNMAYLSYLTLFRELADKCFTPVLKSTELPHPFVMETGHTFLTLEGGVEVNGYLLIIHVVDTGEHYDYCFDMDSTDQRLYNHVRLLDPDVEPIQAPVH